MDIGVEPLTSGVTNPGATALHRHPSGRGNETCSSKNT